MPELPNRLAGLAAQIESGETVTPSQLEQLATLQAIDLVQLGRQFVEEATQRDKEFDDAFAANFGTQPGGNESGMAPELSVAGQSRSTSNT